MYGRRPSVSGESQARTAAPQSGGWLPGNRCESRLRQKDPVTSLGQTCGRVSGVGGKIATDASDGWTVRGHPRSFYT